MNNRKISNFNKSAAENLIKSRIKYLYEKERRASFTSWVFSENCQCNVSKLAEAGFVFVGTAAEPDSVICFLCEKSLDSWDEDDDPFKEHLKHSERCSFAKKGKKEDEYTLSEFVDLKNEFTLKILEKCKEEHSQTVSKMFDNALKMVSNKN